MSAREVAVKKYVVRLSAEERGQLDALIRKGKSSAQRLMNARIQTVRAARALIAPRLPTDVRGVERADDRRVSKYPPAEPGALI